MGQYNFLIPLIKPDIYWLQYWNNYSILYFPFAYWKYGNLYWFKYYQYKKGINNSFLRKLDKLNNINTLNHHSLNTMNGDLSFFKLDIKVEQIYQELFIDTTEACSRINWGLILNTYIDIQDFENKILKEFENIFYNKISIDLFTDDIIESKDNIKTEIFQNQNFWADIFDKQLSSFFKSFIYKEKKKIAINEIIVNNKQDYLLNKIQHSKVLKFIKQIEENETTVSQSENKNINANKFIFGEKIKQNMVSFTPIEIDYTIQTLVHDKVKHELQKRIDEIGNNRVSAAMKNDKFLVQDSLKAGILNGLKLSLNNILDQENLKTKFITQNNLKHLLAIENTLRNGRVYRVDNDSNYLHENKTLNLLHILPREIYLFGLSIAEVNQNKELQNSFDLVKITPEPSKDLYNRYLNKMNQERQSKLIQDFYDFKNEYINLINSTKNSKTTKEQKLELSQSLLEINYGAIQLELLSRLIDADVEYIAEVFNSLYKITKTKNINIDDSIRLHEQVDYTLSVFKDNLIIQNNGKTMLKFKSELLTQDKESDIQLFHSNIDFKNIHDVNYFNSKLDFIKSHRKNKQYNKVFTVVEENEINKIKNSNKIQVESTKLNLYQNFIDVNLSHHSEKLPMINDMNNFHKLEQTNVDDHWLVWEQRWWFLKALQPSDHKILPKDVSYPLDFDIIQEPFPDKRVVEFEQIFQTTDIFELKIFDKDYNRLLTFNDIIYHDIVYNENNIQVEIDYQFQSNGYKLIWKIVDYSGEMNHLFLTHPTDQYNKKSTYALSQDFYDKQHPIPFGDDMGLKEISIPINIMADFLNILLMIWTKLFHSYTGFTGYKAVTNLLAIIYDWLALDTSQNNESIEYYERCYRWLRWEAESILQKCKTEPDLRGNFWVEKLIYELIDYMESHHVNYLPVWEDLIKMDEQRNIFNDPTLDMEITLNKVKGIRHKVIENNRR